MIAPSPLDALQERATFAIPPTASSDEGGDGGSFGSREKSDGEGDGDGDGGEEMRLSVLVDAGSLTFPAESRKKRVRVTLSALRVSMVPGSDPFVQAHDPMAALF